MIMLLDKVNFTRCVTGNGNKTSIELYLHLFLGNIPGISVFPYCHFDSDPNLEIYAAGV